MIEFLNGDILQADAEALVNTVNCEGVMGRGIALQFKKRFPENFKAYAQACHRNEVKPGKMFIFDTGQMLSPRYIVNFPTKRHWRSKSRMEDIESGLDALVRFIRESEIRSIAIPPLGSGLGGLNWSDVRKRIDGALQPLTNLHVMIYEPRGAPSADLMTVGDKAPTMTLGRAVLVELVDNYLCGLLDPFISLLELHKLMYFMQEAGQPLKLRYVKATYGPYAENLRHTLNAMEGHLISGYADGGDNPSKPIELKAGAVEQARALLRDDLDTKARFKRVTALLAGFESSFGVELLASVHWVMTREHATTPSQVEAAVYGWGARKRQFTERQIGIARERLLEQHWVAC